ncbi:hypothetical protein PSACC_02681 [Paramicrosporidium saccamoebae]|uniref:Uncharacterized protein n=1 Tax=Paramicrosporidium saccamoebae TaxID=1246581 RepID=A0A2H9TIB8_9FUNG|nr:hypothetical protein PSACC_02681 [Paramicrosporidium saccamoebae]
MGNECEMVERVERLVTDFGRACVAFYETCRKRSPGRLDNLQPCQKRRIKPTLVASFGLVGRLDGVEQIEPVFTRTTKDMSNDDNSGPKLHKAWHTDILPLLATSEEVDAGWISLVGLNGMVRCLRSSQQFMESSLEQGLSLLKEPGSFELLELLAIVCAVLKKYSLVLFRLAPSQALVLRENHLFRFCADAELFSRHSLSWARQGSLADNESSDSSLDAVPLAYLDRRDSRNTCDHQLLHANQQKLRDHLLNWIRLHCYAPDGARLASEATRMLHGDNFGWFAELLLHEYEQLANRPRLAKLEERLTKGGDNPVLLFVTWSDSYRLTIALQQVIFTLIETIMAPIIDGTTRAEPKFSNSVIRLTALGRLLAVCTSKQVGRYEDPVLCFVRDSILEAWSGGYLLTVLPWALTWLRDSCHGMAAVTELSKLHFDHPAIKLLLDAFPMDETDFVLPKRQSTNSALTIPLDGEYELCGMERILSNVIPEFKTLLSEISLINITPTPIQVALPPAKPPRKVRPTPSSSPSALQKKLRQWLWWQYPTLREVGEVLGRHLEGRPLPECVNVIWSVVPPLLPPPLNEHERMRDLVIALFLELVQSG